MMEVKFCLYLRGDIGGLGQLGKIPIKDGTGVEGGGSIPVTHQDRSDGKPLHHRGTRLTYSFNSDGVFCLFVC